MIKILRIINRFNIGGPTYNATFLTKNLSKEYTTMLIGGLPEKDEADSLHIPAMYGVKPIILEELQRNPNIFSDLKAYRKIKKIIKEYKPDIVHTHAAKAGALGRKAAFSCKVPIIVHTYHGHVFHSYFGKLKTWIYKFIERQLAKKSNGIIAISETQKYELSKIHNICDESKIKIIPLGFDLDKFINTDVETRNKLRIKYNLENDDIAIAIIGRFAFIKNHSFFFDVIDNVLKSTKRKIRVFVVGDGEARNEIRERANLINNKFKDTVILTSWINDIYNFNQAMDIICLTSKNEGTPVSLIEAQASGKPIITTNVGGVQDIMIDKKSGYIINNENLDEYSKKLIYLIENDEIRKEMGIIGRKYVKDKYHYLRLCKDMEDYYFELLKK